MAPSIAVFVAENWFQLAALLLLLLACVIAGQILQLVRDLHASIVGDVPPQNRMLMELGMLGDQLDEIYKKLDVLPDIEEINKKLGVLHNIEDQIKRMNKNN